MHATHEHSPSRTESQVLGACKHKRDGIEANGPGEPPAKKGKTTSDNGEPEEDYTKYNSRSAVTKQVRISLRIVY